MSRYDLVIYGASGFTGAYVVECLVQSQYFRDVQFAIAGRSETRLRKVLADVSDATGTISPLTGFPPGGGAMSVRMCVGRDLFPRCIR